MRAAMRAAMRAEFAGGIEDHATHVNKLGSSWRTGRAAAHLGEAALTQEAPISTKFVRHFIARTTILRTCSHF